MGVSPYGPPPSYPGYPPSYGELPVAVVVPHKERAQALITDQTASNATAMERAIDEIFAESGKVTTKSNPWKTLLKLVTADQRALLDQARAKRLSDVRSAIELMNAVQRRVDAQRKGSKKYALPTQTTGIQDFDLLEYAPHMEIILAGLKDQHFSTKSSTQSSTQ